MGISNKEREEFIDLAKRMLELYHSFDQNDSLRKIVIGYDIHGHGDYIAFFQGNHSDAEAMAQFLRDRKRT